MMEWIEQLKAKFKEYRELAKSFQYDGRTKDCFFYDKNQCRGKIKKAHSLQKNGVLNIIESEVNGNKVVYCFQRMKKNKFDQYLGFEDIGKNDASTFFGFCGKHDTDIFQLIENYEVDIRNDNHKFLLCYRAAAREYHRKVEQVKSFTDNPLFNKPELKKEQESGINGSQTAVNEMEEHRTILNSILQNGNYNNLRYLSHSIDYSVPIACSGVMTPKFYLDNDIFNLSDDLSIKYEHIYLTVIPTQTKTHVLYACLPNHTKAMRFLDDLEHLSPNDLEEITCSLMVNEIENGFISPKIYELLSKEEKEHLIQVIELSDKIGFMQFFNLGFNFLQNKYQI